MKRHGPYEVLEILGQGATATVHRARHATLDRPVALKVLHRELDGDSVQRFQRELKLAIGLSHDALVRVLDGDPAGPEPYLVMELVEGGTLADRIAREGALPAAEVAGHALRLIEALQYLHQRSLLHRDLKPGNILIASDGSLKVADFGLARPEIATMLTPVGTIVGTLAYMAPEVLGGEPASPASDAWAIGAILHEMLTGRSLLEAVGPGGHTEQLTLPDWVRTLRRGPLELPRLDAPGIPRSLASLVRELLSPEPGSRPALDEALTGRLRGIGAGVTFDTVSERRTPSSVTSITTRTPGLHRVYLVLAGLAALGALLPHAARQRQVRAAWARALEAERGGNPEETLAACRAVLAMRPAHGGASALATHLLMKLDRPAEALAVVDASITAGGSEEALSMRRAALLIQLGRLEEGERELEALDRPGWAWPTIHRGLARERAGRLPEAIRLLEKATEIAPGDPDAHGHLARILVGTGRVKEALPQVDKALAALPETSWLLQIKGQALAALGDPGAGSLLKRAVDLEPDDLDRRLLYARYLIERSRFAEAGPEMQRLRDAAPRRLDIGLSHVQLLQQRREFARAEAECRRLMEIERGHHDLLAWLGEALLAQEKLADFEREVETPARGRFPDSPMLLDLRGRWNRLVRRPAESEALLRAAVARAPEIGAYRLHLGSILLERGKLDEALDEVRRGVELDGGLPLSLAMLADVHDVRQELEPSVELRRKAIALLTPPHTARQEIALASALQRLGRREEAVAALRRAVQGGLQEETSLRTVAERLYQLGQLEDAAEIYRRLIRLHPGDTNVRAALFFVESEQRSAGVTHVTTH